MKRKLCILCCIAIIISMVGCTSEKKETNEERSDTKIETNEENEESKDDVILRQRPAGISRAWKCI